MTEQQEHLVNLTAQLQQVQTEISTLTENTNSKRELLWRIQGAIEYLAQVGVTLPEPPVEEESEETEGTEET